MKLNKRNNGGKSTILDRITSKSAQNHKSYPADGSFAEQDTSITSRLHVPVADRLGDNPRRSLDQFTPRQLPKITDRLSVKSPKTKVIPSI